MPEPLIDWLAAYAVHSTTLLALVWALERGGLLRRLAHAELAWRWALFGPMLTASVPLLIGLLTTPPQVEEAMPVPTAASHTASTRAPAASPASPVAPTARPMGSPKIDEFPWRALAQPAALLWLAGALAGLAMLAASALWLAAAVRRLPRNDDAAIEAAMLRLSRRAAIRPPRLRSGTRWASPLLTPGGTICLPRWTARLEPAQREAVLAHELAHLLRRDPAWRVAAQAVVCLAWLQPLNRVALRRLDTLAELACDAWAARITGSPVPLAESLLHAAERRQGRPAPRLVTAMSRRRSPLAQRLHRLLEGDAMSEEKPTARRTRWIIAACVLAAAVAVPAIAIRGSDARADDLVADLMTRLGGLGGISNSIFHNGSITRIETRDGDGRLRIDIDGRLQFNDAEDQLTGVDGKLEIRDTHHDHKRRLLITGRPSQALQRSFERDGASATMNADDDAWFAGVVDLLVQATISADEQVRHLLAHGGVPAVLARIDRIANDAGRSALIQALMKSGPQSDETLDGLIARVGRLGSDYERRSGLQALTRQPLADAQQLVWLQTAAGIGSDFETRTALASLAPQLSTAPAVVAAWQAAVEHIHSDFETRTVIETQMQALKNDAHGQVPPALVNAALAAIGGVHSDFEHRTALVTIVPRMDKADAAQVQAYANSAAAIGSDFERREALIALVQSGELKTEGYGAVLGAASSIGSSFETLTLLHAVAERMPADPDLIARYRRIARKLGDFERGQAEKAIDHLEQG